MVGGATTDPFYWHGLTLIQAWISNYIQYEMWDEIIYPILNVNDAMDKQFHRTLFYACNYPSMLGLLKLNHIIKRGQKCLVGNSKDHHKCQLWM